jgi:RNase H-fold protein (predicted Holliday junction resolvase)
MRHCGYTIQVSNRIDCVFCWIDESIYNKAAKENVTSSTFRQIMGEDQKIESVDKKNKVIIIKIL